MYNFSGTLLNNIPSYIQQEEDAIDLV
jgi:hypothetical protein